MKEDLNLKYVETVIIISDEVKSREFIKEYGDNISQQFLDKPPGRQALHFAIQKNQAIVGLSSNSIKITENTLHVYIEYLLSLSVNSGIGSVIIEALADKVASIALSNNVQEIECSACFNSEEGAACCYKLLPLLTNNLGSTINCTMWADGNGFITTLDEALASLYTY